ILGLLGWGARMRREAIGQLNERIEAELRAALKLRRGGDLAGMKTFVAEGVEACAAAALRYPRLAEPHALQGRMQRAMMDFDRALEEQELALARDSSCPRARYERLVLTARLLRRREDELVERAWRGLGEKLIQEGAAKIRAEEVAVPPREKLLRGDGAARGLRERMEGDLDALESGGRGEIGAAELACARGIVKRSRPSLQIALAQAPFLEEAVEALALLEQDAGRFEKAVAVWSEGLDHDKGCLPHLEGRGEARLQWGQQMHQRGEDPSDVFIAAIGDFSQALEKDPRRDGAMRQRGLAHFYLGVSIGWKRSDDATRQFQSAAEDLGRALELNPKAAPTWMWRGVVRAALSVSKLMALQDPVPLCQEAMEDLAKAIERNPQGDEAYSWRAVARIPWSIWIGVRGGNVEPLYNDAIADLGQALKLNPGRGETWLARANIHIAWANYQAGVGKMPREPLLIATRDLDVATQKIPDGVQAPERRGRIELMLAAMPGEDAAKRCLAAADCFETVLARSPKNEAGLSGRGEARMRLAVEKLRRKENPASAFDDAFRDLEEALKTQPSARILRAEAYVHRGDWKAKAGRDAEAVADFQAAISDAKQAIEANPLFAGIALIWQGRAKTLAAPHRPIPMAHYSDAINDFNKVLFFSHDHLQALRFRADAYRQRALLKAGRLAEEDYQSALTDYLHVVRLQEAAKTELRDEIAACRAGLEASKR
ncbi:MAG: hypothetical protein HY293_19265, partial [Planctomycetes bacterium]|nr:hypothetical protein [Planctomycetota bacterium]